MTWLYDIYLLFYNFFMYFYFQCFPLYCACFINIYIEYLFLLCEVFYIAFMFCKINISFYFFFIFIVQSFIFYVFEILCLIISCLKIVLMSEVVRMDNTRWLVKAVLCKKFLCIKNNSNCIIETLAYNAFLVSFFFLLMYINSII